jgi:tetratricopeptide (TPR) repeat protein
VIDFLPRLTESLAPTYRLERELGGGGMSRVFLAEEPRLGRRVVVKVLPPETSAGIPADRFEREIRVAGSLQHPHLVPVLSAGGFAGIVYYVMPYIEGDSLAARLARDGALPVDESVRILRDIADALAYAHGRGVVHRDVKPDNILLSGRHAFITDFGVAKAVTDAAGSGATTLTGAGIALGTPTYMAPEQAAADTALDHRADIYALGVVAYEMLSGQPPFTARTPQGLIAAHVTLAPDPVGRYRPGIPAELAAAVMRCLEKHPADRWQSAEDLLAHLDSASRPTPSGGVAPTLALPAPQPRTARVAVLFTLATLSVTATAYALSRLAGLPDWVWIGTLVCMLAGLPIMLYTSWNERRRAKARATGEFRPSSERGLRRWVTWRRSLLGGVAALGTLGLLTAGYAASRAMGIGPAATLLSAGTLASRDQLVLADFVNRTSDSTLGAAVTEALRVDLGQSRAIRLLNEQQVAAALRRANVPDSVAFTEALARDVAVREGAKAVVTGEIMRLGDGGGGYVLTAQIVSADSGAPYSPVRATAASDADLIAAVNRLSGELRERIGESLKSIRESEPLEQVTTASLLALRLYTNGTRAFTAGDYKTARDQLKRATAIDTAFAMAWRKLGATYFNLGGSTRLLRLDAARRAFSHRDRLPPYERHLTEAYYYTDADREPDRAIAAYRAALEIAPNDFAALNNLGMLLTRARRFAEAEQVLRQGVEARGPMTLFVNLNYALISQSKWAAADSMQRLAEQRAPPGHRTPAQMAVDAALARREYEKADSIVALAEKTGSRGLLDRGRLFARADLEERFGHLGRSAAVLKEIADSSIADGDSGSAAALALVPAWHEMTRERPDAARAALTRILAGPAFRTLGDSALPAQALGEIGAIVGDPALVRRAKRVVHATQSAESFGPSFDFWWAAFEAESEGKWREAAASYGRVADLANCSPCGHFYAARMWDRAGVIDSAIAYYKRGVEQPATTDDPEDAVYYPLALRRLGYLSEQRGDPRAALDWYNRFLDLWKSADPELQPIVQGVRERVAALTAEPRAP